MHERYRQTTDHRQTDDRQTDGRTTTYSEHEHEFTFAKNLAIKGKFHQRETIARKQLGESPPGNEMVSEIKPFPHDFPLLI